VTTPIPIKYLRYCFLEATQIITEDKQSLLYEAIDFVNKLKIVEIDWPKKEHSCIYSLMVSVYKRYYLDK